MLDGMRRHKGWLKWSLALVCLAFVFLYVPGFLDQTAVEGMPSQILARVGDQEITVAQFSEIYQAQLQNFRDQSSGEVSEEVLQSLGIDRQILQGMITQYTALYEAKRLGLTVSDSEVTHRIITMPALQENGRFVGETRYRQALQNRRPPIQPRDFEELIRDDILFERLQSAITGWITVSEQEIATEHRRRNEKVKVDIIAFHGEDYREDVQASREEIEKLYAESPSSYQEPEKRKLRFVLIDESAIFENIIPSDIEIQEYYDTNISQYTTDGEVRASQILLRAGTENEEAVRTRATELITLARSGSDFAELAKEHSEDQESAPNGGDLGLFGRGRVLPEIETAAFDLSVGEVSDPIKSILGFHIVHVTEKKEEIIQPLEEVQEAIQNTIKNERATTRANDLGRSIASEVSTPEDLEQAAQARGLELQESDFVAAGEPILGLGFAPQVSSQAFQMDQGAVEGPIPTPTGPAFVTVIDQQDAFVPPLEEVENAVRQDVINANALTFARERASKAIETLQSAENFKEAAENESLVVVTSELLARGTPFPEVGISATLENIAFSLAAGETSDVIETATSLAIVRVVERQEITPEQIEEASDTLRMELVQERQNKFYSSYIGQVQDQLDIDIDYEVFGRATGN